MTNTTSPGTTARMLLTMSERTAAMAEGLARGIDPALAGSKPSVNGNLVDCNHPVFIFGHLSIYPQRILRALGEDPGKAAVPASYEELFSPGASCRHDPDNTIYPPFAEVLERFRAAHRVVRERLASLDDETLSRGVTGEGNERAAEIFGTVDAMALFMLHDHYMFHLGQLSTWRRCFGLGSAMG